jgi:pimeloyl-ACP methyl ester carboxylesterase
MLLVYIHGANATSESFNYIRKHLGGKDFIINYDSRNGFQKNLEDMGEQIKDLQKVFFICHSLGGIYALHLANKFSNNVIGAVTLSTPYGGAEVADVAKYFLPYSRLLKDIGPNSWAMREANKIQVQHPWCNIVTTQGDTPWVMGKNDGVVTIASQKHHGKDMDLVEVEYNHYEVVLSNRVIQIIQERLSK